jgi:hypothetical protein
MNPELELKVSDLAAAEQRERIFSAFNRLAAGQTLACVREFSVGTTDHKMVANEYLRYMFYATVVIGASGPYSLFPSRFFIAESWARVASGIRYGLCRSPNRDESDDLARVGDS